MNGHPTGPQDTVGEKKPVGSGLPQDISSGLLASTRWFQFQAKRPLFLSRQALETVVLSRQGHLRGYSPEVAFRQLFPVARF